MSELIQVEPHNLYLWSHTTIESIKVLSIADIEEWVAEACAEDVWYFYADLWRENGRSAADMDELISNTLPHSSSYSSLHLIEHLTFSFFNEEDAILFRLRWF